MFEIEYKGANSVIINSKKTKIVVDPKLSLVGLRDLSVSGAIELVTEDRFSVQGQDSILYINGPGEYGIADLDIIGIPARRKLDGDGYDTTMYRIETGGNRIGIIGNIDEKLSDEQLESLGVIDVLIIPVGGGGYTLDATNAVAIVKAINPKVVIPIHYNDKGIKYEVPQDQLDIFKKEMSAAIEVVTKYKIKQSPIITATLSIIEITRN